MSIDIHKSLNEMLTKIKRIIECTVHVKTLIVTIPNNIQKVIIHT